MNRLAATFAGLLVLILIKVAIAETNIPERTKSGNDLTTSLNGTDVYVQTTWHLWDGGTNNPRCDTLHNGWNVSVWCDGTCYVSNRTKGVDGGALRILEMIPLSAYTVWPMGLLGNAQEQVCVSQSGVQSDGGTFVQANFFRRY